MDIEFVRKYCMNCESHCYYREAPIVDLKQTIRVGCLYTMENIEDIKECPKGKGTENDSKIY